MQTFSSSSLSRLPLCSTFNSILYSLLHVALTEAIHSHTHVCRMCKDWNINEIKTKPEQQSCELCSIRIWNYPCAQSKKMDLCVSMVQNIQSRFHSIKRHYIVNVSNNRDDDQQNMIYVQTWNVLYTNYEQRTSTGTIVYFEIVQMLKIDTNVITNMYFVEQWTLQCIYIVQVHTYWNNVLFSKFSIATEWEILFLIIVSSVINLSTNNNKNPNNQFGQTQSIFVILSRPDSLNHIVSRIYLWHETKKK